MAGWRKIIEEFAPLATFFVLNSRGPQWFDRPESESLLIATAGFMAAMALALASTYARGAKPNNMTLASAGFIFVFGGITLFLQDETFIKIKPTLVYILFASILGFGLLRGQSYLQRLMGDMLPMEPAGWLVLTRRWVGFFIFLAALNEAVWRTQTTDAWVSFKVFAILPLTFGFMILQMPLLKKHGALSEPEDGPKN
jgi:intracellular septation protein